MFKMLEKNVIFYFYWIVFNIFFNELFKIVVIKSNKSYVN